MVPELLAAVTVSPPVTYPNGDQACYLELTFRCRVVGGSARVNDEESLEVAWFAQDALPELDGYNQERLKLGLDCTGETAFRFGG